MIAALPMYDRPENCAAHDALWQEVRTHLGFDAPRTLARDLSPQDGWAHPDLILGQICNLPYRARFKGHVKRLGAGDYGLPDLPAGYYRSVFIVRTQDARLGLAPALLGRFACNEALSQSGWGAPQAYVQSKGLAFREVVRTGSHLDSLRAVASGRADCAAIDAVTWRMFADWEPDAARVEVVGQTAPSPGMTFITGANQDADRVREALVAAIAALAAEQRETLGLRGIVQLPDSAYDLPLPPELPEISSCRPKN